MFINVALIIVCVLMFTDISILDIGRFSIKENVQYRNLNSLAFSELFNKNLNHSNKKNSDIIEKINTSDISSKN